MHEMPKPGAAHEKLGALVGKWIAEEKLSPGPWGPGGPATGHYTVRWDLDGFFLVQDYIEEKDSKITYRGHGIFGYDASTGEHLWYWFDSMGVPPPSPSRGRWIDDTLILEHHQPAGHGRYTFRFAGEGQYSFKIENSRDGVAWHTFMESVCRRVGTP